LTISQVLSQAVDILSAGNIKDPSLESELLLRHTLNINRIQLYLDPSRRITPEQRHQFWDLINRRLNNEPSAYIIGHREFYGLDFFVDSSVLIPRPESELLVEKAIKLTRNHPLPVIVDIGTGCGAIAVNLALNLPASKIYATDISALALKVAYSNCRKHGVTGRIHLLEGDLLEPLPEPVNLVVANLPYVRQSELSRVNTIGFEPLEALDGGTNGLDTIRRLCTRVAEKLSPDGSLLLEIGQNQGKPVSALLRKTFPSARIETIPDLGGIERVVVLNLIE